MTCIDKYYLAQKILYKTPKNKTGNARDIEYNTEVTGKGRIILRRQQVQRVRNGIDLSTEMMLSTNIDLPLKTVVREYETTDYYYIESIYKRPTKISNVWFYLIRKYQ